MKCFAIDFDIILLTNTRNPRYFQIIHNEPVNDVPIGLQRILHRIYSNSKDHNFSNR